MLFWCLFPELWSTKITLLWVHKQFAIRVHISVYIYCDKAPVPYSTMHHFVPELCTTVHISATKWCIAGYLINALSVLWDGYIIPEIIKYMLELHKRHNRPKENTSKIERSFPVNKPCYIKQHIHNYPTMTDSLLYSHHIQYQEEQSNKMTVDKTLLLLSLP